MRIAAKVAHEKAMFPWRFCREQHCLWRVETRTGAKPCPKHRVTSSPVAASEVTDPAERKGPA